MTTHQYNINEIQKGLSLDDQRVVVRFFHAREVIERNTLEHARAVAVEMPYKIPFLGCLVKWFNDSVTEVAEDRKVLDGTMDERDAAWRRRARELQRDGVLPLLEF